MKNLKKWSNANALVAGLLVVATNPALGQGTVIFQHFGANDPIVEGFGVNGTGVVGPVDGDFGFDAWSINARSLVYWTQLSPQQLGVIAANDWTVTVNLRILTNASIISLTTGAAGFAMYFASQPDGDPIVYPTASASYALEGGGPGYHNYELKYSASSGTANLWIDGVQRLSGLMASSAYAGTTFGWGTTQNPNPASANWNLVSLSVVPEPSALSLLSIGVLLAVTQSRRWHSKPD